ncbi:MAG: MFS transporter [Acidimicrobiales bacterium]
MTEPVVSEPMVEEQSAVGPWIPATSVAAATWALFLGLALVMVGNGLNGSLLGVRSTAEGFGLGVTGLVMASYFAGFLVGTLYAEYALKNVGHIRVFAALASLASTAVLVQALVVEPATWALMRFVFGGCMAGLYVVTESWLNDLATNKTRGRILSIYMMVSMGGLTIGQLMLNIEDDSGFRLFIIASVLVSVSLVPVALSATSSPPYAVPEPMPFRRLVKVVPTGLFSSFWSGVAAGALIGMAPVYAADAGLSAGRISVFLAAPLVGALVAQFPIGWLSDQLPRRGVMLALAIVGSLAALVPVVVEDGSVAAILAMGVLGAAMFPLYSLTIAYTNDWLKLEQILGASATLVRVNGSGAIAGPVVAAGLMALFGAEFLFWTLSGTLGVIAVYVFVRIVAKDPLPFERQREYVPFPARASAVAANLIPRRRR